MDRVLALDLATNCGWQYWVPGMQKPRGGLLKLPEPREGEDAITTIGRWAHPFWAWAVPLCRLEKIEIIVTEAPILKLGFGENKTMTTRKTLTLAGMAGVVGAEVGARVREVPNSDMIGHWLGRDALPFGTDERKRLSMLAAKNKGFPIKVNGKESHDTADAGGVLDFFTFTHDIEVPWDNRPSPGYRFIELQAKGVVRA